MGYTPALITEKSVIKTDGVPAVLTNITLPSLPEACREPYAKNFGKYYAVLKSAFLKFAGTALKKESCAALSEGKPPYGAVLKSVISHETKQIISVFTDAQITDGNGRRVYRTVQLWRKSDGALLRFADVFQKNAVKKLLLPVKNAVKRRAESGGASLYSDWESRAKRFFNRERFYISPCGTVFFYPGGRLNHRCEIFPAALNKEQVKEFISIEPWE